MSEKKKQADEKLAEGYTQDAKAPEKKPVCFVIMPISDVPGYEPDHFSRVYEYLLKPAIENAGYRARRADDENKTDYIVIGIIQQLVVADMVLCDLSARNPNVMYELGIRHAFNKPVTLIKDRKTANIFDIQGLRYTEYSDSLRADLVENELSGITKALRKTAEANSDDINSVVQLAGITAAEVPDQKKISSDTQLILSAVSGLSKRLDGVEKQKFDSSRIFGTPSKVVFPDGEDLLLGEKVYYREGGGEIGTLIEIDLTKELLRIQGSNKHTFAIPLTEENVNGLSRVPF